MTRSRSLPTPVLAAGLLLALASAAAGAQEYRLGARAEPLSQAVRLRLDPAEAAYSGSVSIEMRLHRASDALLFHAEELELERVLLRRAGTPEPWTLAPEVGEWGTVTARAGETLAPGDYTLEIDFRQEFDTRAIGLYRMEQAGKAYLFTQFEPDDARKAFPCWDEPGYKIPYQLTLEVPAGLEALSNTPIERESEAGGVRTVVFAATPPTPSYLLALAVGPLEAVEIPGMSVPGRVVTTAGQSHLAKLAVEITPPLLAALERYFGQPYPYAKLDLVAVPEYASGAMENPGAITFSDDILLLDEDRASLAQRQLLARVIAHELAHIWFGDLVTLAWWDDLWLNESFADWMGYKVVEEVYPELEVTVTSQNRVEGFMVADARPSTVAVRRRVDSRADITEDLGLAYGKGKEVLGMIERWVGADVFRTGVNRYLAEHAWGNAAAEDLWSALSEASGRDLRRPLATFLEQPGLPLVTARVVEAGGDHRLVLEQERFRNAGVEVAPQLWSVPVAVALGRAAEGGGEPETRIVLLDRPRLEVPLERPAAWVMPHADATGYYRWRLPEEELLELAASADRRLSPVERVAFLGNAQALLDAGVLDGGDYLEVLEAFGDDPDPEVLRAHLAGLNKVQSAFVPDDLLPAFRRYLEASLAPVVERWGLEPREGEGETVSLLRPSLLYLLGEVAGSGKVVAFARKRAQSFLENPASVDPATAGILLRIAARGGDEALFDTLRRRFESATDPTDRLRLLRALASFEDEAARERALAYALEGPLRPDELLVIPGGMTLTEAGQDRGARWVMDHLETLSERFPPRFLNSMPWIASGCSIERLREVEEFFSAPRWRTEGVVKNLEKVSDQVEDCVRLRRREGAAVRDYLSAFGDRPQAGASEPGRSSSIQ